MVMMQKINRITKWAKSHLEEPGIIFKGLNSISSEFL